MFQIASFYQFFRVKAPNALKSSFELLCRDVHVKGTLLIASEGINGTITGSEQGVQAILAYARSLTDSENFSCITSWAQNPPLSRMKVRLKREIVTMGRTDVDPTSRVGTYLSPQEWNSVVLDPDVTVIDTRNHYEVAVGRFRRAVDPKTDKFRDFPQWWANNQKQYRRQKIAMYCTGGIRCEKATSFLLGQGVTEVYHLRGGILRYLQEMKKSRSLWDGSCFVFDRRVSVEHGLVAGRHVVCGGCRHPISPNEMHGPAFEMGVSCQNCFDKTTAEDKERFRERQKQIDLALERSRNHRLINFPAAELPRQRANAV
ncbi:MAG: rhodanese-related sulfurtransferase [Aestuariivita sp.]|nr:rhodanese-related sulfurtransferase [Aestuariivita sp.]MCY4201278.1 rhodanese-related sulfurtransferase [Aestuariivita sp.]